MNGDVKSCSVCAKEIAHKFSHWRAGGDGNRRSVHMDHLGRYWDGTKCPVCSGKYGVRKKRGLLRIKKTNRKCNICGLALPPSRYFNHEKCLANRVVEYMDWGLDYQYHQWKSGG